MNIAITKKNKKFLINIITSLIIGNLINSIHFLNISFIILITFFKDNNGKCKDKFKGFFFKETCDQKTNL